MSAKQYQIVLNADMRKHGKQAELLPVEDIPPAEPLVDDPDGIVVPGAAHKPKQPPKMEAGPRVVRAIPKMPGPVVVPIGGGGGGPEGGGGGGGDGGDPPAVEPPPTVLPLPGVDGNEDGITAGPQHKAPAQRKTNPRRDLRDKYKDGLFGSKIIYEEWVKPDGNVYKNYTIRCTTCEGDCHKTKGRYQGIMKRHGELQPLAALHAWLDTPAAAGKTHAATEPTPEHVDAVAIANKDELRDLWRLLTGA